ncbi:MAG: IS1595 family transposase [Colwellia sp.]|nr:IS1595 family transposase [Colwellia sp.]
MKLNLFTKILCSISKLTINQKHSIVHRIHEEIKRSDTDVQIDECKGDDVKCPHCGSNHIGKWGVSAGLQRYRCKSEGCRRTFNALTKTPLARLRKRALWQANLDCMFDGLPLWRVAEVLGISITTAFRWRHRFLKAPTNNKPSEVTGIIEADEMFFLESYKGKRTIHNRPARKRGGVGSKKLKEDRIPVLIVKDRSGGLTDFILKSPSKEEIHEALMPIVNAESVMCTDGASAYKTFAKEYGIKHYRNITSQGTRVIKRTYHIQNVNNYMSRLRVWMTRFHGVGTAYLANYLGWMRMMEDKENKKFLSLDMLLNSSFDCPVTP